MIRIALHPLARAELQEAVDYYENERRGLGAAFLLEVERTFLHVQEQPHAGVVVLGTIRRRIIQGFPYSLLYAIETKGIVVYAVANLRRRPFYWLERR